MVLMSSAALAADPQIRELQAAAGAKTTAKAAPATAAEATALTRAPKPEPEFTMETFVAGAINGYCVAINWVGIYHPEVCNLLNPPMLDLIPSTTRTQNTPGYAMKGQIT